MQRWSLSLVTVLLQLKYVTVHFSQSTSWRCIVGVEVQLDSFLTRHWMKVNGCLHIPAALPVGKEPQYPLNKRLFGPRAGLDILEKRRIPYPYWDSNPCPSSPRSIALYRLRYLGLTKNVILRIYFNLTEIRALRNGLNSFALHKIFFNNSINFSHWIYTVCHKKRENMWSDLNRTLSAANTLILRCPALDFVLSAARKAQVYGIQD